MGETRVDLQHLLEDIRDAYPGSLDETIVTEIVANSLDSGARLVRFELDAAQATLTAIDDGSGMVRRELARYHDIAASGKSRGEGIGFAGVGIKLGILASEEVLTETRRGQSHVATSWHLASRHRAPWHWVPAPGLVAGHGTAVRLKLHNPLAPLLEPGFLEATLLRHFQPLFDPSFDELLEGHYPAGVRFAVNGRRLERSSGPEERAPLAIRIGRKRKPGAVGYLVRHESPPPEELQGLAVSTLGKVIKRGWDWLGFAPAEPQRIGGLIDVPALAECLTLNKADFIRSGPRGALYLAYRKAVQEAVAAQLAAWGDTPDALEEHSRRRKTRPVERDLAGVLLELADDFPLLASLVERRAGGQKRLPMGGAVGPGDVSGAGPRAGSSASEREEAPPSTPPDEGEGQTAAAPPAEHEPPRAEPSVPGDVSWPGARARKRPARLGLTIQFENRPDDPGLGRLLESTVWVNEAHPAWQRAAATRAEGYHLALTVAMALAPLAVDAGDAHAFVTAFLARWGEALEGPAPGRRAPARRRTR